MAARLCVPAASGGTVIVHVPSGATMVSATTWSPSIQRDRGSRLARTFEHDRLTRLQSGGDRPLDLRRLACARRRTGTAVATPVVAVASATTAGVATTIWPSATVSSTGDGGGLLLAIRTDLLGHQAVAPAASGGTVIVHVPSGATVV